MPAPEKLAMSRNQAKTVPEAIRTLFVAGTASGISDRQHLERFVECRDEGSEAAFAALVDRHGAMVLRVCRQLLGDVQSAEDAFQATFLVLARRAAAIREPERLGPWLYGVARRVAKEARARGGRPGDPHELTGREGRLIADEQEEGPDRRALRREECQALHEELGRLPAKYLEPIVLCYFVGLTHDEAANRLRWPVGTVSVRLRRARKILEDRLTRRGFAPTALLAVATGIGAGGQARAGSVPASLAEATIRAVRPFLPHLTTAWGAVPPAALIAEGVIQAMFWSRIRILIVVSLVVGLAATGSSIAFYRGQGAPQAVPQASKPVITTEPEPRASSAPTPAPVRSDNESPPPLSDRAQSRIMIARQIRDHYFRRYQAGQVDLDDYLKWQMRFTDLIEAEVGRALKDFDPVMLLDTELKGFRTLERHVNELVEKKQVGEIDSKIIEFYRLEIEEKLERAKAKARPAANPGEAGKAAQAPGRIPPPAPPVPSATAPLR
jgi:RNA polymerase sigma factor (sigma-70 family)